MYYKRKIHGDLTQENEWAQEILLDESGKEIGRRVFLHNFPRFFRNMELIHEHPAAESIFVEFEEKFPRTYEKLLGFGIWEQNLWSDNSWQQHLRTIPKKCVGMIEEYKKWEKEISEITQSKYDEYYSDFLFAYAFLVSKGITHRILRS